MWSVSLLSKLLAYARILPRGRHHRTDLVRYLARRPALLVANATYETAVFISDSVDARLKTLAALKTSALVGCPF